MSRVGKSPIPVPSSAKVEIQGDLVKIEGPKGKLQQHLLEGLSIDLENGELRVSRQGETGPERAKHGLIRALVANAVHGVTEGWNKVLEINGVGYRGEVQGRQVHLSLGYSHPVIYDVPAGITVEIDKQNKITVSGADKQQVGQVSAELRALRPPDAYKGKGIKYADEVLRLKVGKAGVGGGG